MDRRKEDEEEHSEGSERWLLTYADMITLLLTLFIVLYSMSTIDLEKFKQMAANMSTAFHNSEGKGSGEGGSGFGEGEGIIIPSESTEDLEPSDAKPDAAPQGPETEAQSSSTEGTGTKSQDSMEEVYRELQAYVEQYDLETVVGIEKTDTYLKITLKDKILFFPDSKEMIKESIPILNEIGQVLTRIYDKIGHITISGYTATTSNDSDTSNDFAWELSANRAVSVLNCLVDVGLPDNKLSVEGCSHYNPVAPNDTEENRAKNRRVEITITRPPVKESGI